MDPERTTQALDPRDRIPPGGRAGPGFDAVVCPACSGTFRVAAGAAPARLRCPCGADFPAGSPPGVPETRVPSADESETVVAPPAGLPPEWRHGDTAIEPAPPRPASATAPPLSATRLPAGKPGTPPVPRFGKYEILAEVARGGMGVVYRARQAGLNREVALKMLLAGEGASEEQVRRFLREAESAAKLSHPGIVPIYDVGAEDGKHYFAMEFIHGESAAQVIERMGMVPPRQALKIAREVALALQYAHERGIVHRDIKPANIMLAPREVKPGEAPARERDSVLFSSGSSASFRVVVTDFGLAKDMGGDSVLTVSGTALGTPVYMPPEQADADLKNVGPRSDVYSLGAVLYEMITGEEPFEGSSVGQILAKVISQDPVPPRRRLPGLHRDVETIILTAMAKERERRYASAQAMADDIERYLKGEAIAARPASLPYRAWKLARRHKAVSAALAAFAAVSIAWAAFALTRPGYLQLAVEPHGARVAVDGAEVRPDAPQPLLVRPGGVRIRVEAEGYEAEDREIVVRRNETRELRVALRRQTGRLEVIAEPRGSVVELDGQEYGTPLRNLELPTGPVSFRLKAEGSYSRFFDVRLERGKTASVRGILRPAVAWTRNLSTPGPKRVGEDADGDGVRDLYHVHFQQILQVFSGRTGEILTEFYLTKYLLSPYGEWHDVDGDGFAEYVAIRTMEDKARRLGCLSVRPGPEGKLPRSPVVEWETAA
ncbi:MAG: protein kinase, partial [Planctomycetes bacterium]|nr:protein kinase [Planctomycetota bacterium]